MGQISFIGTLILIGLFSFAIIGYAINFANDNEASISIEDDDFYTGKQDLLEGDLENLKEDSEDTYESLIKTTIEGEVAPSTAPFSINSKNAISTVKNVLKLSYNRIFGSDNGFNVFFYSLTGFLTFIMGLYIYKTLRGNPD